MTAPLPTDFGDMMELFCPMHVRVDPSGHITGAGPTLLKLRENGALIGCRFLETFDVLRPSGVTTFAHLSSHVGRRLNLQFSDDPKTALKGVLHPCGSGTVINLSFGISVLDSVRDYALTSADFAVTDPTIEMLYLMEAKSAAMEASRQLNQRLRAAMIAAEEQAFTDTLTGLKNRRALDHVLNRMVARKESFSLMHLDLDYFKKVNDTLGHAAGDYVLQHAARILVQQTRRDDVVARVGGDEFVLVLGGLIPAKQLDQIARRIIRHLEEPIPFRDDVCRISASVGTVAADQVEAAAEDIEMLQRHADIALYASKRKGRARHTFFEDGMRLDPEMPQPEERPH